MLGALSFAFGGVHTGLSAYQESRSCRGKHFPRTFFWTWETCSFFCSLTSKEQKLHMVYLWRWLWREGGTSHKNITEPFANTKCETDTGGHLAGCTGRLQTFIITPGRLMPVPLTHSWGEVFFCYRWACQACSLDSSASARAITGDCIAQCVSPWEFGGLWSGFLFVQILHLQSLYHFFICGVIYLSFIHSVSIFLTAMMKNHVENTMTHSVQ